MWCVSPVTYCFVRTNADGVGERFEVPPCLVVDAPDWVWAIVLRGGFPGLEEAGPPGWGLPNYAYGQTPDFVPVAPHVGPMEGASGNIN